MNMLTLKSIGFSNFTGPKGLYIYAILLLVCLAGLAVLATVRHCRSKPGNDRSAKRFYRLANADLPENKSKKTDNVPDLTLEKFCDNFRRFAASQLKLYYDKSVIRSFVAGLSVTRTVILQGISGTGKTSLAYALGRFIGNDSVIIPVQPSWKERSDVLGYFNEFTGTFNETTLLQTLYEADNSDKIYIVVLDEMNIARIEYYFAEFLSLLELPVSSSRVVEIVPDRWENDPKGLVNGKLRLPDNVWFIGTANNDDSTMAISDKVYDRAMVLDFDKRWGEFKCEPVSPITLSSACLAEMFSDAKGTFGLTARNKRRIKELDEFLIRRVQITFGNRIMKQIEEYVPVYVACGGSELEAIDGIMAKKVLRKLDSLSPVIVRNAAGEISAQIEKLFGEGNMPMCERTLRKYARG